MIEINHVVRLAEPTDAVFAVLSDLSGYPTWQADVLEVRVGEVGPGAAVHQVRKVMGRRTEVDLTVTEYLPGEALTLRTAEGTKPGVSQSYRVHADGTGSRVEFRLALDGVPRMAEHLARALLGKQVPQMFERLAAVLAAR